MQIEKRYYFHAAHRNEELVDDKCFSLHGHTYQIGLIFETTRNGSISTLFSDIDKDVEPLIKILDHSTLLHAKDIELGSVLESMKSKMVLLPFVSSAENMCFYIFNWILLNTSLNLHTIKLRETTSSTIHYQKSDYEKDCDFFNQKPAR